MKDGLRNKLAIAFITAALAGTLFLGLPPTQAALKSPIVLVYSMEADFQPDGHFNFFAETGFISHAGVNIYSQLAPHVLGTTTFYPELAASWSFVGEWLFVKLRTDVTWHDAVPFNATDVWCTFMIRKIKNYSEWGSHIIDDVQVVNASTVKFHVTGLHDLALNWLLSNYIYAANHIYHRFVDEYLANPANADNIIVEINAFTPRSVSEGAVGTGPYMVSNMTESDLWLKKYANYYAADKIVADYIHGVKEPSNEVGWGYFFSNTADWGEPFAPVSVASVLNASGTKVFLAKSTRHDFVVFNWKNPLLAQLAFRQGFAYALNRTELILAANYPVFHEVEHVIPYSGFYAGNWLNTTFLDSLNFYGYDVARAKSLFESCGLSYNDKEQLCYANGSVVTLYVKFPAAWTDVALMMANVATQLNRVGVTVIPLALDWATVTHSEEIGDFDLVWDTATGDHPYSQGFDATNGWGFPTYASIPKVITWQGSSFNLTRFFTDWAAAPSTDAEKPYVAKLAQIYNYYLFALPFSDTDTMFYGSERFIYPPSYDTAWMCTDYARGMIVGQILMQGKFALNATYWTVPTQPPAQTPIETYLAIGLGIIVLILAAYILFVRKK